MFKTARFKIHNPSRHKQALLLHTFAEYHRMLDRVLSALANPDAVERFTVTTEKGKQRIDEAALSRELRHLTPKGWRLAPL